jgi:Flp pilus assembly protein TadD
MNGTRCITLFACVALACAAQQPDLARAQRAMSRELIARGDYRGAFAAVDPVCREHPRDAEALTLRGSIYREQGLMTEAQGDLEEAARLAPKSASTQSALAILYDMAREGERALEHHRIAAELEPKNPSYQNNLGFSLFARGRAREAIAVLSEALRNAPTDTRIRNNLGFCYAAVGDLPRAAEQFERAGNKSQARNNLGYAYERRGNAAQAFQLYVEALRLDPASQVARQNLSRVARQLNRDLPSDLTKSPQG